MTESLAAGERVANYVDSTATPSKDTEPESNISGESAYLGPFKYTTTENGEKLSFNSIEVIGKDENGNEYLNFKSNPTIDLCILTAEGYKSVANGSIEQNKAFYIRTDKRIDESSAIKVKINIDGPACYKSRLLYFQMYAMQTFTMYSIGNGEDKPSNRTLEYEFENNKGNIEIHKKGIFAGKEVNKVENMGFKFYYLENNKKQYLKLTTNDNNVTGNVIIKKQEVTDQKGATIVYTDNSGALYLRKIDSRHKYYLEEITDKTEYSANIIKITQKLSKEGAKEEDVPVVEKGIAGPITVEKQSQSKLTLVTIEDARKTGNLQIIKEDYDKTGKKVSGVKFKVQNVDTKQWVKAEGKNGVYNLKSYDKDKDAYKDNYTSDESKATEFETNANGEVTINGVDTGKYVLKEVYINNNGGKINYGYTEVDKPSNVDKNYVFWSIDGGKTKYNLAKKDIQLTVQSSEKADKSTIYVYNKKKYLKITGFVWEDMLGGKANNYEAHGKDVYKEGDILVDGITVKLIDRSGKVIKTETTKDGGKYEFTEVSRESLEKGEYFVEFEYNGITYTSVVARIGDDDTINSKASEDSSKRKSLNEAFAEITNKGKIDDRSHGYSRNSKGTETSTLTYIYDKEKYQSYIESSDFKDINFTANTDLANFKLKEQFEKLLQQIDKTEYDSSDALVIRNVNLGLLKREQPQMSISNDVDNALVTVNGYEHTYKYAKRNEKVQDGTAFNVAVKFESDYRKGTYTREIYPSDIQYSKDENTDDKDKLKVYVTYATTIRNMSNSLKMSVNELVNYYDDEKYKIVDSWIGDNEEDSVEWNDQKSKYGQTYKDGNYKGAYTTSLAGTKINAGENLKVYIKFQVDENAVKNLLNGEATLYNVTEIFSYSTYYGDNTHEEYKGCKDQIYAGIDSASAPGNAKPGDEATYEADTDDAPSLILVAKGVREIEGTVFEDAQTEDSKKNNERLGDGMYQENEESTVAGVKVELVRAKDGTIAKVFPPKEDINKKATEVTDAKEKGIDAIAYARNEDKMLVDNGGLTGKDGYYKIRGIEPDEYLVKYTYANGTSKLYTTDNKEVDITVQDYKSTIITSKVIKEAFNDISKADSWYKTEVDKRYSDARDDYIARNGYNKIEQDGSGVTPQIGIDGQIETVDGTTKSDLMKPNEFIKSLEAKTPNLKIRVEYDDDDLKSESDGTEDRFTVVIPNVDFGIVERPKQSANLDKIVKYLKVTLPNGQVLTEGDPRKGDLQHVSMEGNLIIVTIDPELLYGSHVEIDYEFTLENTSEKDYRNESYYYYGDSHENPVKFKSATLIDYVDKDMVLKVGQERWTVLDLVNNNKGYNWNLKPEEEEALFKNYSTVVKAEALQDVEIEPGQKQTSNIIVEKKLANGDSELTFENNGEIVQIIKNGGRTVTTNLGSYAPRLLANPEADPEETETDDTKSEIVKILPPTGSTDNTVTYAIISVIGLAVLGAGVYGIKRFLKK